MILAIASAIVALELISEDIFSGEDAVRHAVFNVTAMMTTTGFASADFNEWTSLTTLVLFGVVMISASAGSTSGSIKLVRHVVIAKMLWRELDQTLHPHRVAPLRVNRERGRRTRAARDHRVRLPLHRRAARWARWWS